MDLARAMAWPMVPFVLIFLFMVVFDTLGTLVGVSERAGRSGQPAPMRQAFMSDALGSVVGGVRHDTVTSFIESTAGVEQGGHELDGGYRGVLFLVALFSAHVAMVGSFRRSPPRPWS